MSTICMSQISQSFAEPLPILCFIFLEEIIFASHNNQIDRWTAHTSPILVPRYLLSLLHLPIRISLHSPSLTYCNPTFSCKALSISLCKVETQCCTCGIIEAGFDKSKHMATVNPEKESLVNRAGKISVWVLAAMS